MSSFLLSTEVHRNSDADNYRTKKRTAIKSSVCELKLLKQKKEGRKCSTNVVCITWISQYCRISFLFENIWVFRRTFKQSLCSAVVKIAKLCGHWLKCLQKDEIFVARQCAGKQEGNQYYHFLIIACQQFGSYVTLSTMSMAIRVREYLLFA